VSNTPLIAVVDDDEAVRDALLSLLQVEGLRASGYAGAGAFLEDLPTKDFSCLITDVRMPGMGGLDLQCCLMAMGSSLPIIFVTSAEDAATLAQAEAAGAAGFFTKPLASAEFLKCLKGVLGLGEC
jgi:FixJ family two-component response regulator